MDPYDLPDELAVLQSQDMSKIGFMQDLLRGIEKVLKPQSEEHSKDTDVENPLERLVQNSETYLKLENYDAAEKVFKRITREYPEDYRGWWGLIVCKLRSSEEIADVADVDEIKTWLSYVKQLVDSEDWVRLEARFKDYLCKCAEKDAANELRYVNDQMQAIEGSKQQVLSKKEQIIEKIEQINQCIKEDQDRIEVLNKRKAEIRPMVKRETIVSYVIGLVLVILTWRFPYRLLVWIRETVDYDVFLIGIFIDLVRLALCLVAGLVVVTWPVIIIGIVRMVSEIGACRNSHENWTISREVESLVSKIEEQKETVSGIEEELIKVEERLKYYETANEVFALKDRYYDYGHDKIVQWYLTSYCRKFDLAFEVDAELEERRKAFFDKWGSETGGVDRGRFCVALCCD